MKTSWPRVEVRVSRKFRAWHSLPHMGNPEPHRHNYETVFGFCHEINPTRGEANGSLAKLNAEIDLLMARVENRNLDELLPVTPTAEWLACWLLANVGMDKQRTSYIWDFVVVRAYGCFEARIDRRYITAEWLDRLRFSAIPVPTITVDRGCSCDLLHTSHGCPTHG